MEVIYGCDWFIDKEHAEVIKERIKAIPSANALEWETTFDKFMRKQKSKEADMREHWKKELNIPSAEPKTGHWIEHDGWDGDVYYECSECKEPFVLIDGTPSDNLYHYCPNCGAKMVEPQERSE